METKTTNLNISEEEINKRHQTFINNKTEIINRLNNEINNKMTLKKPMEDIAKLNKTLSEYQSKYSKTIGDDYNTYIKLRDSLGSIKNNDILQIMRKMQFHNDCMDCKNNKILFNYDSNSDKNDKELNMMIDTYNKLLASNIEDKYVKNINFENKINEIKETIKKNQESISHNEKIEKEIKDLIADRKIQEKKNDDEYDSNIKALKEIKNIRIEIDNLNNSIRTLIEVLNSSESDDNHKYIKQLDEIEKEIKILNGKSDEENQYDLYNKEYETYKDAKNKKNKIDKLVKINEEYSKYQEDIIYNEVIRKKSKENIDKYEKLMKTLAELNNNNKKYELDIIQIDENNKKISNLNGLIDENIKKIKIYEIYTYCLDKQGVQRRIIDMFLKKIVSYFNDILGSITDLSISFSTINSEKNDDESGQDNISSSSSTSKTKDIKKAKLPGISIKYSRDSKGGRFYDIGGLCGYEKTLLNIVLRITLMRYYQTSHMDMMIIDEGFNYIDGKNMEGIGRLLEKISEEIGRIIIITHDGRIKDKYDGYYTISKDKEGNSKIGEMECNEGK